MTVTGLITEYNPFHNGHLFHLEEAKARSNADYIIVVMSGDFVQRGTPAILDKYARTETALSCGADLVLMLPCAYSAASAEFFSLGAVTLLEKTGITDYLCFGSEAGSLDSLSEISLSLSEESELFQQALREYLKQGMPYPTARSLAFQQENREASGQAGILSSPNNILGIEYLKALKRLNSSIQPITFKRQVSGYHDTELSHAFSSATSIRNAFAQEDFSSVRNQVPPASYRIMEREYKKSFPVCEDDFSLLLYYELLTKQFCGLELSSFQDVSEDLARRINRELPKYTSFRSFSSHIKTRQYTLTRINRSLLHILLQLKKKDYDSFAAEDWIPYIRILGFRKTALPLLKSLKKNASVPVINKVADAGKALSPAGRKMLSQDIYAANLYRRVQETKYHTALPDEYRKGVLIL